MSFKKYAAFAASIVLGMAIAVLMAIRATEPTPMKAHKFYLKQGKEACREALALVSPVINEAEQKRLEAQISNIRDGGLTPLVVMQDISHHEVTEAKKKCLQQMLGVASDLAYLPYAEQFVSGEEEKARVRARFPDDFREAKERLKEALAECRKLRDE